MKVQVPQNYWLIGANGSVECKINNLIKKCLVPEPLKERLRTFVAFKCLNTTRPMLYVLNYITFNQGNGPFNKVSCDRVVSPLSMFHCHEGFSYQMSGYDLYNSFMPPTSNF